MEEKEVGLEIGLSFKKFVLELDDQKFQAILTETIDSLKNQVARARETISATKAAEVEGQPTLAEKGVEISVGIKIG